MSTIKILHINCSDSGSTGKIISDISKYSAELGDVSVLCTPLVKTKDKYLKKYQTSLKFEQGIYRRICKISGLQFGFAPISTIRIVQIIKKENPDIVHLHSINGNMVNVYKLLNFLKKKNIPTVVTNHAEFLYTGNCAYEADCEKWKKGCGNCPNLYHAAASKVFDRTKTSWKRMKKSFYGFNNIRIVSVSPWITFRAKQSPIMEGKQFYTILNGVNTNVFYLKETTSVRQKLSIPEKASILLHVTSRFSDKTGDFKGGDVIIELAKRLKEKNVFFVVAGKIFISSEIPANIILLNEVSDQEYLSELYSAADITIITSKRETFSMPVAESLCCGTPVVGFEAGGPESIAIEDFSQFVSNGDIDLLEEIIIKKWINFKRLNSKEKISETAKEKYNYKRMAKEYYDVYTSFRNFQER